MRKNGVMTGSRVAPEKYKIVVSERGPYMVFGSPPLAQQIIVANAEGESVDYSEGLSFEMRSEPTALCRCGSTNNAPYCDGSHTSAQWNAEITAPVDTLLDDADIIEGSDLRLSDNERYCAYARFCDPAGGVWRLTEESADPQARKMAVREASLCPAGRLAAWGKDADEPFEMDYEPSLGLLEDTMLGCSSGLWARGGIPIERENGIRFEVRNRVVLCRCGGSHNKPYCDGSHAKRRWSDSIEESTTSEK